MIIGAAGEDGAEIRTIMLDAADVPQAFVAVTLYDPGATLEKIPVALFATDVPPVIRL